MSPPFQDPQPEPDFAELELSDQDILAAMRQIPGYLDVTTGDFREIYHLAHRHALARQFGAIRAGRLMRTGIEPLRPDLPMVQAARIMARQALKSLPVVEGGRVIGMLTETDFLGRLGSRTFLGLLTRLLDDGGQLQHQCRDTQVYQAMTQPAVTVPADADFRAILAAFQCHPGRSMPVVDDQGHLLGLLARKEFLTVLHPGEAL